MTNITCPDCGGFAPVRVKRCEYCANDRVDVLEAEVARLRAERDAARAAARAWKRKAYQWRNEAANALGLWPNVGWRVSELRRWYREYIR